MMAQRVNLTDRAKRYRAQKNVTGPRKCVLCGSTRNLDVMHLDGNESHGEPSNLAYGCRSCNGKLAAAFKRLGKGVPTNQYNPAKGGIPTFDQYKWAVSHGFRHYWEKGTGWIPGEKDGPGAIIHATPKHLRTEYAKRILAGRNYVPARRTKEAEDRWNPTKKNLFETHRHYTRRGAGPFREVGQKLSDRRAADELNAEFLKRQAKPVSAGRYKGYSISKTEDGEYFSSLDPSSWFETKLKAQKHIDGYLKGRGNPALGDQQAGEAAAFLGTADRLRALKDHIADVEAENHGRKLMKSELQILRNRFQAGVRAARKRRGNPAAASAEVFEEFHGYAPNEVVKVTREVHHHTHLAAAGDLAGLKVKPVGGGANRDLEFGKDCLLAFNERKSQLFIEGGDQRMSKAELKKFGVTEEHELHTIGKLIAVGYFTDKTHLGDEGGEAVYSHTFKTTNENGKHVTVRIARYPDLIYRVLDEQFEISGGSYEILREGIDK